MLQQVRLLLAELFVREDSLLVQFSEFADFVDRHVVHLGQPCGPFCEIIWLSIHWLIASYATPAELLYHACNTAANHRVVYCESRSLYVL